MANGNCPPGCALGIQPAEHPRKRVTLSLTRRVMEPGNLFHSSLTCPPRGNAGHLKSKHTFVSSAQQLIGSSDDNNRSAALWTDRRWNTEWLENTCVAQKNRPLTCCPSRPIHRPPYGVHGLTVLDDETIEWLLSTWPEIWCGLAVVWLK